MSSVPWWGWLLIFIFVIMPLLWWAGAFITAERMNSAVAGGVQR